jgi:tRNA(fMet)-specific endonuclease VapC
MAHAPLYILDTDHISLLQRGNPAVSGHLRQIDPLRCAVTVIILAEQVQGRLAQLHGIRVETDAPRLFRLLQATMMFYQGLIVLPYDEQAAARFIQLRKEKLRFGTQDLRIASIALVAGAVVVTRNWRDFRQVPGLMLEDWSSVPSPDPLFPN